MLVIDEMSGRAICDMTAMPLFQLSRKTEGCKLLNPCLEVGQGQMVVVECDSATLGFRVTGDGMIHSHNTIPLLRQNMEVKGWNYEYDQDAKSSYSSNLSYRDTKDKMRYEATNSMYLLESAPVNRNAYPCASSGGHLHHPLEGG